MTNTFYLKQPNSKKDSLIYFSCYFKYQEKKFVYSTGEKVDPQNWDFENKRVYTKGKNKTIKGSGINIQLNRYIDCFETLETNCKTTKIDFTPQKLKKTFDEEFKKAPSGKNIFFDSFDEFIESKTKKMEWSASTVIRYTNVKNLLQKFQINKSYKLSFNSINDKFLTEFTDYCINTENHVNNTFYRNIGFIKSFLFWALKKGYTYNAEFKEFKRKPPVITNQIALKLEDIETLMKHDLKNTKLERVRDIFIFSCMTGMRVGELKFINKENIIDEYIILKEEKDTSKASRKIPLTELSKYIILKYDYKLPLISPQKYNDYIKDIFEAAGYTQKVEKFTTQEKKTIRETMFFYERMSSHTARRTFITLMKEKGKPDKLIAKITGQKDMRTLNQYYQVRQEETKKAVIDTFDIKFTPLKKVVS